MIRCSQRWRSGFLVVGSAGDGSGGGDPDESSAGSRRLGWTKQNDPVKVENDLNRLIPKDRWTWISHALILHGRARCLARSPRCEICVLEPLCPKIGVVRSR